VSRRTIKIWERNQIAPAERGRSAASWREGPALRRPAQERRQKRTRARSCLGSLKSAATVATRRAPAKVGRLSRRPLRTALAIMAVDLWRIEDVD
jgi:hypothetical protein